MGKNIISYYKYFVDHKTIRNALSNYGTYFINGMIAILLLPLYINQLGPNQWGFVAFSMTMQGLFMISDAGISQILPSKISIAKTLKNQKYIYFSSLKIYFFIGLILFIFGQVFANKILSILVLSDDSNFEIYLTIYRLTLLQFFFQLPNNAAISYWSGRKEQHYANIRQLFFAFCKHCSAILLILYNPIAVLYIAPFIFFCFLETTLNVVKIVNRENFPLSSIIHAKNFTFLRGIQWICAASVLGMLGFQIDRLFLVKFLSIDLYGKYIALSTLALMFMNLNGPIYKALLPVISVTKITKEKMKKAYSLFFIFSFIPCIILAIFSEILLGYWLSEINLSQQIRLTFILLIFGVGLNSLNGVPYIIYIRYGLYKNIFFLNSVIIIIELFLLSIFYTKLSFLSGAIAFFAGMLIQFFYGIYFLWRFFKKRA